MSEKPCFCFINTTSFWGGGERFNLDYSKAVKAKGLPVILIARKDGKLFQRAVESGIETIPLSVGSLSFLNPFKLVHLSNVLRKKKVNVIVISSSEDLKLAGLASKIAGIPRIVYRRGLAVVKKGSFLNRYYFGKIVTDIICNSKASKKSLTTKLDKSLIDKEIHLIPNGIDLSSSTDKKEDLPSIFYENKRSLVLGNVGRLTEQKGQGLLLEMAKELKHREIPFSLFIAGSGELEDELRLKISNVNLDKEVFLLGFRENIASFLKEIEVFVLSSLWEGFGYVLIEAMQQKKPLIAFAVSSNPEIVEDGQNGFLVNEVSGKGLADAVEKYYLQADLKRIHGNKGYEMVHEKYSLQKQVDQFLNIFNVGN